MASTPVSPKVHTAAGSAAAVTLVMYLLDQLHAIATMPVAAKGALLVIVTGVVTWVVGYAVPDALRLLGAKFDNNPATAPAPKNEAGEVVLSWSLVIAVVLLLAFLFGWGVLH